jgi:hypothetical protein
VAGGGARPLTLTTLANVAAAAHAIGDSGPIAAAGYRYLVVGATLTADPGATGFFLFEMLAPDGVTWVGLRGVVPNPNWLGTPSDQQEMGVDSYNFAILFTGDVRIRWSAAWTGTYWVVGAS